MIGSLYDPVKPYLSNPQCNPSGVSGAYWYGVTFWDFATQTSGMPRYADGPYANQLFADDLPPCPQLAWNDNQTSFANNLGYWTYSNAGFVTLGFAVAAAAADGTLANGYTRLLENVITEPLGMPKIFAAADVPPDTDLA